MRSFLQDLEVAAEFSLTNGVTCLLEALKKSNYVKVGLCLSCTNIHLSLENQLYLYLYLLSLY